MAFDFTSALKLVSKKFIVPTIMMMLLYAGGWLVIWGEYKEVLKEKNQLAAERKSLNDEVINLEKNRASAAIVLAEKKTELEKREFILQQLEGQNKEKLSALQEGSLEVRANLERLQSAQATVSKIQRAKEVEDKIQTLMSKFSELGVNLNASLRCDDIEGERRFNAAKSIYSEIYTLAEANGLVEKYNHFFFRNGQSMYSSCRK